MAEEVTEYIILDIIDDMEESILNAEKHDMTKILEALNSLHGEIQDLGNADAEDTKEKIGRLNTAIEQPLKALVEACQAGEASKAEESMRTMIDKMAALKDM